MKSFLKKRGKSSETTNSGLPSKKITRADTKCKGKGEKKKKTISDPKSGKSTERLIKCRHVAREMRDTKKKPEKVLQNIFPKIEECNSDSGQNVIPQERKHGTSRQHLTSPSSDKKYNSVRRQNLLTLIAGNKELTHFDEIERRTLRAKSTDKKRVGCSSKEKEQNTVVPDKNQGPKNTADEQAIHPKSPLLNDFTPSSSGIDSFVTATDVGTDIVEMCKERGISISVSNEKPKSEVTCDINVLKLDCQEEKTSTQYDQTEEDKFSNEENKTGFPKSYHKKQLPLSHDSNSGLVSTNNKTQDSTLSKIKISQSNTYLLDFLKGNNLPLNLEARKRLVTDTIESIASTEPPCNGCKSNKIDAANNHTYCVCSNTRSHVIHKPRLQNNKLHEDSHNVKEVEQELSFQTEKGEEPKRELIRGKSPPSKREDGISKKDISNQMGTAEVAKLEKIEKTEAENRLIKETQSKEQLSNNLGSIETESIGTIKDTRLKITSMRLGKPTDSSSPPFDCKQDVKYGLRNPEVKCLKPNHVDNSAKMLMKKVEYPAEQTFEEICPKDSEVRPPQPSDLRGSESNEEKVVNCSERSKTKQPQIKVPGESVIIQSSKTNVPYDILTSGSGVNLHQSRHHDDYTPTLQISETHAKASSDNLTDLVSVSSDTQRLPTDPEAINLNDDETKESEQSEKESPSSYIIVYPDRNVIRSPQTLVEKALKLKADRFAGQFDQESQDTFLDEIRDICAEILEAKMQKLQKKVVVDDTPLSNSCEKISNDCSNRNTNESRKSGDSKVSDESQETYTSGCSQSTEDSKDSQSSCCSQSTEGSKDSQSSRVSQSTEGSKDNQSSQCSHSTEGSQDSHGSACSQETEVSQDSQGSNFTQSSRRTETSGKSHVTFNSQRSNSGNEVKKENLSLTVFKKTSNLEVSSKAVEECEKIKETNQQTKENQRSESECAKTNQERRELEAVITPEKQIEISTQKIEISTQTLIGHDTWVNKVNSKVLTKNPIDNGSKLKRKSSYDHWVTVRKHGKLQNNNLCERNLPRDPWVSNAADKLKEHCDCNGRMFDSLETKCCDLSPKSNIIQESKSTGSISNHGELLISSSELPPKGKMSVDIVNKDQKDPEKTPPMKTKPLDKPSETDLARNGASDTKGDIYEKQETKNLSGEDAKTPFKGKEAQMSESNNKSDLCKKREPEIKKCKPKLENTAKKDVKISSESDGTKVTEQRGSKSHEKIPNNFVFPSLPDKLDPCSDRHLPKSQATTSNKPLNLNENTALPLDRTKTSNNVGDKKQVHPNKIVRIDRNFKSNSAQEPKFFGAQVTYRRDSKQSILNTTEGVLKVPTSRDNKQNVTVLFEEVFPLQNHLKALEDVKSRDLKQYPFRNEPQLINVDYNYQHMPNTFAAKKKSPIYSSVAPSPFRLQLLPPVTKRQDLMNKPLKLPSAQTSLGPCFAYYEAYNVTTPNEQQVATKRHQTDESHDLSNQQKFSNDEFTFEILGQPSSNNASDSPKPIKVRADELNTKRICAEIVSPKLTKLSNDKNGDSNTSYKNESKTLNVEKSFRASTQSPKPPKVFQEPYELEHQRRTKGAQNDRSTKRNETYVDLNQKKSAVVIRIKSGDDLNSINSSPLNFDGSRRSVGVGMKSSSGQNESTLDICSRCGSYIEESAKDSLENSTINSKDSDLVRFCETLHLKPIESDTECELCKVDSSSIAIRKTNDSKFHIPSNVNIFNQTSQDVCIACEVAKLKEKTDSEKPSGICNTPEKKRRKRQDSKHTVHFDPESTVNNDDSNSVNPVQTCTSFIYRRNWNKDLPERSPVKVKSEPTASISKDGKFEEDLKTRGSDENEGYNFEDDASTNLSLKVHCNSDDLVKSFSEISTPSSDMLAICLDRPQQFHSGILSKSEIRCCLEGKRFHLKKAWSEGRMLVEKHTKNTQENIATKRKNVTGRLNKKIAIPQSNLQIEKRSKSHKTLTAFQKDPENKFHTQIYNLHVACHLTSLVLPCEQNQDYNSCKNLDRKTVESNSSVELPSNLLYQFSKNSTNILQLGTLVGSLVKRKRREPSCFGFMFSKKRIARPVIFYRKSKVSQIRRKTPPKIYMKYLSKHQLVNNVLKQKRFKNGKKSKKCSCCVNFLICREEKFRKRLKTYFLKLKTTKKKIKMLFRKNSINYLELQLSKIPEVIMRRMRKKTNMFRNECKDNEDEKHCCDNNLYSLDAILTNERKHSELNENNRKYGANCFPTSSNCALRAKSPLNVSGKSLSHGLFRSLFNTAPNSTTVFRQDLVILQMANIYVRNTQRNRYFVSDRSASECAGNTSTRSYLKTYDSEENKSKTIKCLCCQRTKNQATMEVDSSSSKSYPKSESSEEETRKDETSDTDIRLKESNLSLFLHKFNSPLSHRKGSASSLLRLSMTDMAGLRERMAKLLSGRRNAMTLPPDRTYLKTRKPRLRASRRSETENTYCENSVKSSSCSESDENNSIDSETDISNQNSCSRRASESFQTVRSCNQRYSLQSKKAEDIAETRRGSAATITRVIDQESPLTRKHDSNQSNIAEIDSTAKEIPNMTLSRAAKQNDRKGENRHGVYDMTVVAFNETERVTSDESLTSKQSTRCSLSDGESPLEEPILSEYCGLESESDVPERKKTCFKIKSAPSNLEESTTLAFNVDKLPSETKNMNTNTQDEPLYGTKKTVSFLVANSKEYVKNQKSPKPNNDLETQKEFYRKTKREPKTGSIFDQIAFEQIGGALTIAFENSSEPAKKDTEPGENDIIPQSSVISFQFDISSEKIEFSRSKTRVSRCTETEENLATDIPLPLPKVNRSTSISPQPRSNYIVHKSKHSLKQSCSDALKIVESKSTDLKNVSEAHVLPIAKNCKPNDESEAILKPNNLGECIEKNDSTILSVTKKPSYLGDTPCEDLHKIFERDNLSNYCGRMPKPEEFQKSIKELLKNVPFGWRQPSCFQSLENAQLSDLGMGDHQNNMKIRPKQFTEVPCHVKSNREKEEYCSLINVSRNNAGSKNKRRISWDKFLGKVTRDTSARPKLSSSSTSGPIVAKKISREADRGRNRKISKFTHSETFDYLRFKQRRNQEAQVTEILRNNQQMQRKKFPSRAYLNDSSHVENEDSSNDYMSCAGIKEITSYETVYLPTDSSPNFVQKSSFKSLRCNNENPSLLKEIVGSIIYGPKIDDVICSSIETFKSISRSESELPHKK